MTIIAYYLPQFYPFEENDNWWGKGFTEWTNVGKARPLFWHHYQPKVPADLGYYDLRNPIIANQQVALAKEAGINAFCYWHYWFGNGKVLLDMPLKRVLESKEPNFPFCLGWANESWKSKVWSNSKKVKDKILIEQLYPGIDDIIDHFHYIESAIKDPRYLRIDNKPIFVIYKPFLHPNITSFINIWNELIRKSGIAESFFFIAHTINSNEIDILMEKGFNAVNIVRIGEYRYNKKVIIKIPLELFMYKFLHFPLILRYSFISKYFIQEKDMCQNIFPTIIPNWDHTPRSGRRGVVYYNSNPKLFKKHIIKAMEAISKKSTNRQILFLKSWNEWGEGNYMEPDLKYGKGYIRALKEVLTNMQNKQ